MIQKNPCNKIPEEVVAKALTDAGIEFDEIESTDVVPISSDEAGLLVTYSHASGRKVLPQQYTIVLNSKGQVEPTKPSKREAMAHHLLRRAANALETEVEASGVMDGEDPHPLIVDHANLAAAIRKFLAS